MRVLVSIAAAFLGGIVAGRVIFPPGAEPPASAGNAPDSASQTAEATAALAAASAEASPEPKAAPPATLHDALKGADPLACAARVLAWLETADAETFRQLAADPKNFPTPLFSTFGRQFQDAYCAAVAERWLALDPEGALAAMQRVDKEGHFPYGPGGLLYSLASRQPEAVLEKLSEPGRNKWLEQSTTEALKTLAARDLKAAQRFAEKWPEPPFHEQARTPSSPVSRRAIRWLRWRSPVTRRSHPFSARS